MHWTEKFIHSAGKVGRHLLLCLPLWLLVVINLKAGVLVAPTSVYLSEHDRTGRMTVQNPSDKPKEISIFLSFGIPESDSLGSVNIRLQDTAVTDTRSAVDWIRVFPRRIILAPGETQVVRFVAHPPKDLPDGEYWARIVIRSEEGRTDIPSATQTDGITTTLNMIMQTAIALKYRTGNLISKIEVADTRIKDSDSVVSVVIDMINRGNVSYVGLLTSRLLDADNKEIATKQIDLAVYRKLSRHFILPVDKGDYKKPLKVNVLISNEGRKDIRSEYIVMGNKVEYSLLVE